MIKAKVIDTTVTQPPVVKIAPNKFLRMAPAEFPPPELVFADVIPIPGQEGAFSLEPRNYEHYERVDSKLSRLLGLGSRTDTLRRLIRGGFVEGARVAPKLYTINVDSFWQHYKRCAEDPEYWNNSKHRKAYWVAI